MSRSLPIIGYRKVTTSELHELCAKERLCQGKFPLNAILPPLRAALAISINECGLCFHELVLDHGVSACRLSRSPTMAGWRSASCAASEMTGWAPDLSAKGGAEGACRVIADRGRNGVQGGRVPLEHGFGQGDAPTNQVLPRRHPDLLAEAFAEG